MNHNSTMQASHQRFLQRAYVVSNSVWIGDAVGAYSAIGNRGKQNQDSYYPNYAEFESLYTSLNESEWIYAGRLYAVADGVTNAAQGKLAAQRAITALVHAYYSSFGKDPTLTPDKALKKAFESAANVLSESTDFLACINPACQAVQRAQKIGKTVADYVSADVPSGKCPECNARVVQMASTLSAVLIRGTELWVAQVGNSPVLTVDLNKKQVKFITVDSDNNAQLGSTSARSAIHLYGPEPISNQHIVLLCTDGVIESVGNRLGFSSTASLQDIEFNLTTYIFDKKPVSYSNLNDLAYNLVGPLSDSASSNDNLTVVLVNPETDRLKEDWEWLSEFEDTNKIRASLNSVPSQPNPRRLRSLQSRLIVTNIDTDPQFGAVRCALGYYTVANVFAMGSKTLDEANAIRLLREFRLACEVWYEGTRADALYANLSPKPPAAARASGQQLQTQLLDAAQLYDLVRELKTDAHHRPHWWTDVFEKLKGLSRPFNPPELIETQRNSFRFLYPLLRGQIDHLLALRVIQHGFEDQLVQALHRFFENDGWQFSENLPHLSAAIMGLDAGIISKSMANANLPKRYVTVFSTLLLPELQPALDFDLTEALIAFHEVSKLETLEKRVQAEDFMRRADAKYSPLSPISLLCGDFLRALRKTSLAVATNKNSSNHDFYFQVIEKYIQNQHTDVRPVNVTTRPAGTKASQDTTISSIPTYTDPSQSVPTVANIVNVDTQPTRPSELTINGAIKKTNGRPPLVEKPPHDFDAVGNNDSDDQPAESNNIFKLRLPLVGAFLIGIMVLLVISSGLVGWANNSQGSATLVVTTALAIRPIPTIAPTKTLMPTKTPIPTRTPSPTKTATNIPIPTITATVINGSIDLISFLGNKPYFEIEDNRRERIKRLPFVFFFGGTAKFVTKDSDTFIQFDTVNPDGGNKRIQLDLRSVEPSDIPSRLMSYDDPKDVEIGFINDVLRDAFLRCSNTNILPAPCKYPPDWNRPENFQIVYIAKMDRLRNYVFDLSAIISQQTCDSQRESGTRYKTYHILMLGNLTHVLTILDRKPDKDNPPVAMEVSASVKDCELRGDVRLTYPPFTYDFQGLDLRWDANEQKYIAQN